MNPHEQAGRLRKAHRLASAARAIGFTSADVPNLTDAHWEAVAERAHCNPPNSTTTITTVVAMMNRSHQ